MEKETVAIGANRRENGTFGPNNNASPFGRGIITEEVKILRRATKDIIAEYKANLAAALPRIEQVLISLAEAGDIGSIKEIHDRVMGKPLQQTDITSGGEKIGISEEQSNAARKALVKYE